mmetsp:Transcript_41875/g.76085  ORF Transcript_41875/g.76085 Transcript_41875/m.76085 type:complete len:634 (+) Transcript_41875:92-1993(+)
MFAMQQPQLQRVATVPSVNLGMLPSQTGLHASPAVSQLVTTPQLLPSSPLNTPAWGASVRTPSASNWPSSLKPQHDLSPRSQGSTRFTEDGIIFSPSSAHTIRMSSDASLCTGGSSSRLDTRVGPSSSSSPLISASVLMAGDIQPQHHRSTLPATVGTAWKRQSLPSRPPAQAPTAERHASPVPRRSTGDRDRDKPGKEPQGFLSKGQFAMRNLMMKLGLKYSLRVSQVGEMTQALEQEGFTTVEALRALPQDVELRLAIPPRMANELRDVTDVSPSPARRTPIFGKTVSPSRSKGGSPIRQSRHSRCERPSSLGMRRRSPKREESVVLADVEDVSMPSPGDLQSRRFPSWVTPFDGSPERQKVQDVAGGFPRTLRSYIPQNSPCSRSGSVSLPRPCTPREGKSIEHHQMRMESARSRQEEFNAREELMSTGRVLRSRSSDTLPDVQRAWRHTTKFHRSGSAVIPEARGRILEGMARPEMCVEVCSEVALTVVGDAPAARAADTWSRAAASTVSTSPAPERASRVQKQFRPPTAVPQAEAAPQVAAPQVVAPQVVTPQRLSTCPTFQPAAVAAERKTVVPQSALRVYTPDDLRFANRYSDDMTVGATAPKLSTASIGSHLVVPQRQLMPFDWL